MFLKFKQRETAEVLQQVRANDLAMLAASREWRDTEEAEQKGAGIDAKSES